MLVEVGYGEGTEKVEIQDERVLAVLTPNKVGYTLMGEEEVRRSLEHPIGTPRLKDMVHKGMKIAIVTSDISRPLPTWDVIGPVLDELYEGGADPKDITMVFALGSHRKQTDEERLHLAGERAFHEIRCIDGDNSDIVNLGTTSRGTPIDIVRAVAEADFRICLGNVEFHYFAGYSGGYKAIMPGVSTYDAIQKNHSLMVDERAHAGNMKDNPVRLDIEEAGAVCGVNFIVNCVLNEHKKIVYACAGDVKRAHLEACDYLDKMYKTKIPERADIVIVSQGGAPKDLNLYQVQKALDNSKHAIRDGGIIILVGSCKEGVGQPVAEKWLKEANKPSDVVDHLKREFKLGGHKAAAIAMVMGHADIYLVSEMSPDEAESLLFTPFSSLEEAFKTATEKMGENSSVIVMPYGGSTLPISET